jgi:hypothetical protein
VLTSLLLGRKRKDSERTYTPPDVGREPHRSLTGAWWIPEFLPKPTKWREWTRRSFLGLYFPNGEPRAISEGALIHGSVFDKMAADESYRPVNLPENSRRVR